jgi:hypothetical protein
MEIVLQWLDELDDLAFAGYAVWQRLRLFSLGVALLAALGLHALPPLGLESGNLLALLDVSLVALAVWLLSAALSASVARSRHSLADNA